MVSLAGVSQMQNDTFTSLAFLMISLIGIWYFYPRDISHAFTACHKWFGYFYSTDNSHPLAFEKLISLTFHMV